MQKKVFKKRESKRNRFPSARRVYRGERFVFYYTNVKLLPRRFENIWLVAVLGQTPKIFVSFCICCFLPFFSLFAQEENRREWNKAAKEKILVLHQSGKEAESLPFLEEYVKKNPSELIYRLYLARALFWRADLELPKHDEDVFSRMEKIRKIRENYLRSAAIFDETVSHLARINPRDPDLGKWLFLWAMSEWYAGREDRAIQMFRKAFKQDFRLNQANYNIAAIYENLGQITDSQIYYGTYLKNEKELKEEE